LEKEQIARHSRGGNSGGIANGRCGNLRTDGEYSRTGLATEDGEKTKGDEDIGEM
jgi:hypothetical protein